MVFQQLFGILASLMVMAALFLLWWKSRSAWLLASLVAEGLAVVLHMAFAVAPTAFSGSPLVFSLWGICALVMAGGLLGYAVTSTTGGGAAP